jgi:hypothetical protein
MFASLRNPTALDNWFHIGACKAFDPPVAKLHRVGDVGLLHIDVWGVASACVILQFRRRIFLLRSNIFVQHDI